jgi:hypothetical protein
LSVLPSWYLLLLVVLAVALSAWVVGVVLVVLVGRGFAGRVLARSLVL